MKIATPTQAAVIGTVVFCHGVGAAVKGTFTLALYIAIGITGAARAEQGRSK